MAFAPSSYGHRLSGAISKNFPLWQQPVHDRECLAPAASTTSNVEDGYFEFFMNTNLILSPEALDTFRTVIHEELENIEVIFDPRFGGFMIRCSPQDEEKLMCLAKRALDEVANPDFSLQPGTSTKVSHITEWRANGGFTPEQLKQYERFTYPHEIARCNYRSTWNPPDTLTEDRLSTKELLPDNAISELQKLTGTKILRSYDGSTVYIGAESEASLFVVRRKLDTLTRYLLLSPNREPRLESFLYGGDGFEINGGVTLHYMSHIDKHLLRTYYLDRADYRSIGNHYKTLFEKGVVARPADTGGKQQVSTAAVDQNEAAQPYREFSTAIWKYQAKESFDNQRPGDSSSNLALSLGNLKEEGRGFKVNQNSLVESWVSHLPNFAPQSYESTPNDQNDIMNWVKVDTKEKGGNKEGYFQVTPQAVKQENYKTTPSRQDYEAPGAELVLDHCCGSLEKELSSPRSISRSDLLIDYGSSQEKAASKERSPSTTSFVTCPQLEENEAGLSESSYAEAVGGQADDTYPKNANGPRPIISVCSSTVQDITKAPETELATNDQTPIAPRARWSTNSPSRWKMNDPFANLWQGARLGDASNRTCKTDQPQLLKNDEKDSRLFHSTMNQQAGSRKPPDLPFGLVRTLSEKLVNRMRFLKMLPGLISLKVDLGRFCFTKINPAHVHLPGSAERRFHGLEDLQNSLNKRHVAAKDVLFTKILTTHGGEANFIAHMTDSKGQERWSPHARQTIYEVTCTATTENNVPYSFIIDINGATFEHSIRQADPESSSLAVHAMGHSWDFRITVTSSLDMQKLHKGFAKDLVCSMSIIPQKSGPPVLGLTNKNASQVKIRRVRTRNIASYTPLVQDEDNLLLSSSIDTNILEVAEVWDMKGHVESGTREASTIKYERSLGNQQAGEAGMWYEASIQSTMISTALMENRNLEFGDEASWSVEEFRKAGAFDKLIRTALDMVESMDGVGYWGDNFQDALVHGIPPSSMDEVSARTARKKGTSTKSSARGLSLPGYMAEYW